MTWVVIEFRKAHGLFLWINFLSWAETIFSQTLLTGEIWGGSFRPPCNHQTYRLGQTWFARSGTRVAQWSRIAKQFLASSNDWSQWELCCSCKKVVDLEPMGKTSLFWTSLMFNYNSGYQTYHEILNVEARDISGSLKVADLMNCMAKTEAFITLKDHKENFASKLPGLPVNYNQPCKEWDGQNLKVDLDGILTTVKQKTSVNLWKNTAAVTNWFSKINRIAGIKYCTFICLRRRGFLPVDIRGSSEQSIGVRRQIHRHL